MKKLVFILTGLVILTSCATTKVEESSKKEAGNINNVVQNAEIRQAVEMRRFIIKFNRLYTSRGGTIDLIPKSNYIILDGDKVVISAAYVGRQYSYRPIVGIDMVGQAVSFEIKDNTDKGKYEIRMKVKNNTNTFDVYVTITADGYCDASMNNNKLDYVRYTGSFIPLIPKTEKIDPEKDII